MERTAERNLLSVSGAELHVERTDISFYDVPGGKVRIEVTVHNTGETRSVATPMWLESAPFGAFVPWRPLARVVVPAMEPGQSREVSVEVPRPWPVPLGSFDKVPPRRLLSALSAADGPSAPKGSGLAALMRSRMWWMRRGAGSQQALGRTGTLAPDIWDLLGRSQQHWAGNINVFIGPRPVERHLAKALRIYPGCSNMAMFIVGEHGKRDAYAFELVGLELDWTAGLYDVTNGREFGRSGVPTEETKWVEAGGSLMMFVVIEPPADCEAGKLQVHVRRRSSGETAIVEFDLDPAAKGSGCYVV